MRGTGVRVSMIVAVLAGGALHGAQVSAAGGDADPAATCRACHQGPMALDRWSKDELVVRITKIRDGGTAHPPLGAALPDDARVAELARLLAGPPVKL